MQWDRPIWKKEDNLLSGGTVGDRLGKMSKRKRERENPSRPIQPQVRCNVAYVTVLQGGGRTKSTR